MGFEESLRIWWVMGENRGVFHDKAHDDLSARLLFIAAISFMFSQACGL